MSRVALADVLWDAANKHLRRKDDWTAAKKVKWSCWAVSLAIGERPHAGEDAHIGPHWDFLRSLGLKTDISNDLNRVRPDPQGARYMWLLLAMHVAEDEGIVIERGAA